MEIVFIDFKNRSDYSEDKFKEGKYMLAILLLAFGVISRLIVHLPNFTPVIALALFGGVYLKNSRLSSCRF